MFFCVCDHSTIPLLEFRGLPRVGWDFVCSTVSLPILRDIHAVTDLWLINTESMLPGWVVNIYNGYLIYEILMFQPFSHELRYFGTVPPPIILGCKRSKACQCSEIKSKHTRGMKDFYLDKTKQFTKFQHAFDRQSDKWRESCLTGERWKSVNFTSIDYSGEKKSVS